MKNRRYEVEILQIEGIYQSDPTTIFNQLCNKKKFTLLLESAEIDKKHALESMIIIDSALRISSLDNIVTVEALTENGKSLLLKLDLLLPHTVKNISLENSRRLIFPFMNHEIDEDKKLRSISIFDTFRLLLKTMKIPKNLTKSMFFGGLFSYDLVNNFEKLPILKRNQKCPDLCFYLAETLLSLDHQKKNCIIQSSLFNGKSSEKNRLKKNLQEIKIKLTRNLPIIEHKKIDQISLKCNLTDKEYIKIIKKMKKSIKQGDIFQVVPSRKFYLPCVNSLSAYQRLKESNPSPYMFFMQDSDFTLFGASPESSLKYDSKSKKIEIYPIAGTRPRGKKENGSIDLDLDSKIELEMRMNEKELSEHLMLVDLARNDLARICEPGSRYVASLTKVDRYSCVMHLVSKIVGYLKSNLDIFHAYCACMNMGTLTGAPKIKAMELISKFEKERRGSYGGSIGYFTESKNFDTCIIIRSAYVENNLATVQAGAGIVLDSVPQEEANESRNKAQAVIQAIIYAHSSREVV
ncbi:anthranilate synthase component 1 [Buchnera aphidicola]|uniref:anthranilate synthase component 1 n=1 Tax=Buchnera aphidicola TaxID=9 RepID=UPI00346391A6